ncbi:MAG: glucosamine-6-phosphate deaminase [Candidatus Marsarchaeota archaeon]|nr:glucosamine-6-phosphate deaminase [Candidatus Marsarchaeota archaeon]MCL5412795.1 glucosamine-6-phosphate deaminase [Candidatus Marsarchaeota archaeon]
MKIIVCDNYKDMSEKAFLIFKEAMKDSVSLGFATGNTPILLYDLLSRECQSGRLSFKGKVSFNLDEYYPISRSDPSSYSYYMAQRLFNNIDIEGNDVYLPNSELNWDNSVRLYADAYRSKGPLDFQVLGIGHNGHIGFNEPGSERNSRIRMVSLSSDTILRNNAKVNMAITMGINEIMESRRIMLLASGEEKSDAIRLAVRGGITSNVPASFLQEHDDTVFVLDKAAASRL